MRVASLFTLAALGVVAAGLLADEPRRGTAGDEKFSDKTFVEKAAIGGILEVKSSQLAERMAASTNVKQFAARMVVDHTKANEELAALAKQKGWHVPTSLDQKHQEMLDQLSKGEGGGSGSPSDRFDRAYAEMQLKGAREDGGAVREGGPGLSGRRSEGVGHQDAAGVEGTPAVGPAVERPRQPDRGRSNDGTANGHAAGTAAVKVIGDCDSDAS